MSVRRTRSLGAGHDAEPDRRRRRIREPNRPTSSARSAPNWARAPAWSYPSAIPKPCRCIWPTRRAARSSKISLAVAPGAHAVVLVDQAGWHTTNKLEMPGNISIIALPAKCPELNPACAKRRRFAVARGGENIWQFMRENWLSNRVFTSYDNIVDHCCEAWNKLIDQPWHIITIGRRNWARGF